MANDSSRYMGEQHGRRDRAASLRAQALVDRDRERNAACLERWPAIVAAMRTLILRHNEGAGVVPLRLAEDTVRSSVMLERADDPRRALIMALDGEDVAVRTRNEHSDSVNGTQWVSLNRTDENAAAYLLREWIE
jgi:hypothetical protein